VILNCDVKLFSVIVKMKGKSINCLKLYGELWSCGAIKATCACSGGRHFESCMFAVSSDLAFCGFPHFFRDTTIRQDICYYSLMITFHLM
jgi:hypothetical protein